MKIKKKLILMICTILLVTISIYFFINNKTKTNPVNLKSKEIIWGMINQRVLLDHTRSSFLQTRNLTSNIFEGLYQIDSRTSKKIPCLADSYTISDNKKIYTFNLKKDVKFHNGQKFTAEDVKFSIERILRPKTGSYMAQNLQPIKGAKDVIDGKKENADGIKIINDYTIQIECFEAMDFFDYIAILMPIYPKLVCAEAGNDWGKKIIVGTGPFKLAEYDIEQGCKLKKFEDYHSNKPLIDFLYFKFYDDINTMMLEYESGENNFVMLGDNVANQYVDNKKFSDHLHLYDNPMAIYYILFNLDKEPWKNKKVREAFSYAIDINSICKNLTKDKITPSGCLTIPESPGYDKDAIVKKYDPEKSLQILKEANINIPVKIQLPITDFNDWKSQIVIALQDQSRKAGFEITTPSIDSTFWKEKRVKGELPMYIASWHMELPNIEQMFYSVFYSKNSKMYSSNYKSSEFDSIITNSIKTFDKKYKDELCRSADYLICNVDFAAIPIGFPKEYYLLQPYIKNFKIKNYKFPFQYCDIDRNQK
ncbi:MAG: ABC transporter substrate-binding protein [Oscillospiraceae bacterium]|jgi:peptide/nickel transport system substrate-binding protein|nr:ABC transporter substrate-binding protein [Oscillospiraceae bacterium]